MKDPYLVIVRPLLTEKGTDQAAHNKYHFRVDKAANKIEIAQAVEAIYASSNVRVLAVNTMNVKGKQRRSMVKGKKGGYSPSWKKAIVTTDKELTMFEGI